MNAPTASRGFTTLQRQSTLMGLAGIAVIAVTAASARVSLGMGGYPRQTDIACTLFAAVGILLADLAAFRYVREDKTTLSIWSAALGYVFAAVMGIFGSVALVGGVDPRVACWLAGCCCAVDAAMILLTFPRGACYEQAVMVMVIAGGMSLLGVFVIMHDLCMALYAGLAVALYAIALQVMPNMVIHVPDRYLVEWQTYMTQRWTVRGSIPQGARALTSRDVHHDMQAFRSRYDAGLLGCLMLMTSMFALLLWEADYESTIVRWSTLTLGVSLIVFLLCQPRSSGRQYERMAMRSVALILAAALSMNLSKLLPGAPYAGTWAMGISMAVGLLMLMAILAQREGFYSLVLSRVGDAFCFVASMLIPASAFLAAGGFEFLRGGMQ